MAHPESPQQRQPQRKRPWARRNNNNHANGKKRKRPPVEPPQVVPVCSVCQTEPQPKYKCPKCRATYCSIACCRTHKETACQTSISNETIHDNSHNSSTTVSSKYCRPNELIDLDKSSQRRDAEERDNNHYHEDDMEEGWKITDEMKERLKSSAWLQSELKDVGLRHLLTQLHHTSNVVQTRRYGPALATAQEQLLEKLKHERPPFQLFLDKLLVVAGVLETSTKDAKDLLTQDTPIEEPLTLAPAKRILPSLPSSSDSDSGAASSSESSEDEDDDDDSSGDDSSDSTSGSD